MVGADAWELGDLSRLLLEDRLEVVEVNLLARVGLGSVLDPLPKLNTRLLLAWLWIQKTYNLTCGCIFHQSSRSQRYRKHSSPLMGTQPLPEIQAAQ